ncbi:ATP synthase subunit O, mitochondrial [Culicoides brevitarsis]|uniref:ATP synthase subunit O, mitochondrial n=1 Tax=Culicoides brevitarsis TaxID=469753 RepID=UPI00307C4AD3
MASMKIASRAYCTATASKLVKPPLQVFGIDGRYACALYSAATKMKQLDAVEKDLSSLQTQFKSDVKLRDHLINPTIKRSLMAAALKDVATKSSWSQATGNFLQSMAENGRLNKIDQVINAFKLIMAAHRGDVVCEVVSAKPLDAAQTKQLEGVLKQFVKANENIKLSTKVDPSLIGGLIVSVGDKYVDMSVASKVKKYKDLISAAA